MSPGIFCAYCMLVPLVWITRMDTGLVFCRRDDFQAISGYNEARMFAEDVQFLRDLRRTGKPRRQRLVRLTEVKAVASTRKFDIHGDWHDVRILLTAPFLVSIFRKRMHAFARAYWYDEQRNPPR